MESNVHLACFPSLVTHDIYLHPWCGDGMLLLMPCDSPSYELHRSWLHYSPVNGHFPVYCLAVVKEVLWLHIQGTVSLYVFMIIRARTVDSRFFLKVMGLMVQRDALTWPNQQRITSICVQLHVPLHASSFQKSDTAWSYLQENQWINVGFSAPLLS